ncbi:hypothetical protein EJ02DRAFT_493414 [Clathrospora elynae]|uniref:Uncharacterized protein n=1 Tax=Clathrospora elynae TaxID=706981 RepID=A0A6A5SMZ9_9PLEO|nr:hypothetical protein EJ02DRAFT_493414 [Clathrospora elynae]
MGFLSFFKVKDSSSSDPAGLVRKNDPSPGRAPRDNSSTISNGSARFTPLQYRRTASDRSLDDDMIDPSTFEFINNNAGSDAARDIKCDILANWLSAKQEEKVWSTGQPGEAVFVKKSKGNYSVAPREVIKDGTSLYSCVSQLNARIQSGLRLQVVPDFEALPFCQRGQSAAFVSGRGILVVWQDDPKLLLERAEFIINALMKMMCGAEYGYSGDDEIEKVLGKKPVIDIDQYDDVFDTGDDREEKPRKLKLWQACYTGMSLLLLTVAIGSGWRQVAIQHIQNPNWLRFLFIICLPPQVWLSLFFFQALVGNVAQCIGRTSHMKENSKYYSGKAPKRIHRDTFGKAFPHVTVQMPVYKEGLHSVIEPTVRSVKQAISTYELQGGTASIFINDDGMQLLSEEEAQLRQEFYDEHGIGWVARPAHDPKGENGPAFHRHGKFKKASNMNYALGISCRVEEMMEKYDRGPGWSQTDENTAYKNTIESAMKEREGQAWADGNIRVGDYILLIDSDTRVPSDCLLEAVSEMEQAPEVAILQYSSGVMNVTNNFFEKGITFFTHMIYTMIRFAVAGGDVAPFVGHNAVLRWSAVQHVGFACDEDKCEKFWSERTVSEDFDMSLRLQAQGYIIRLASYKDDGYKEGVSLTVYDELARWEKYAYGCNELIFNPLSKWITRGPFTKLFATFWWSNMPLSSKITIMSYIGTYYALGSAWILTMLNYFLIGFFNGWLDHYYINSFRVYFAIILVFTIFGNIALAVLRYRTNEATLQHSLLENAKWIPMLTIFLGGISLHVSHALLCHFFGIEMEWGATTKEFVHVGFFKALKKVLRRFMWSFLWCVLVIAIMVTMAFTLPSEWRITELIAVWPMASVVVNHFLLPIVLNPQLMTFTW